MAKVKDKGASGSEMSQAFQDKSKQELDKLKISVAQGLTDDMRCLLENEMHTDLLITNGTHVVKAHKCILQVRSKYLWQESWCTQIKDPNGEEISSIQMPKLGREQLEAFVRQMYTISDSVLLLEEFIPFLPGGSQSTLDVDNATSSSVGKTMIDSEITAMSASVTSNPSSLSEDLKPVTFSNEDLNQSTAGVESVCYDNVVVEAGANDDAENNDESKQYVGSDRDGLTQNGYSVETEGKDHEFCIPTESLEKSDNGNGTNTFENKDMKEISHNIIGQPEGEKSKNVEHDSCHSQEYLNPAQADDISGLQEYRCITSVEEENAATETQECQTHDRAAENVITPVPFDDASKTSDNTSQNDLDGTSVDSLIDNSNQTQEAQRTLGDEKQCLEQIDGGDLKENTSDYNEKNQDKRETEESKMLESLSDAVKSSYSFSVPYETCSSLGRDLLQMYLQEVGCDCCLSVAGVKFLAHKSILSARSAYFHAMMGGQWSESNMEMITLEGVSPPEMEQLLLFLYGGVVELSTPHDLMDLFVVADMYSIVSLKVVLAFYIRRDFCHFFHRPCQGCAVKAADALSLCHNFNLDDLKLRCLKWMGKFFTKIWPTKTFSTLPDPVQQLCIQTITSELNPKNVLDVIMECNKLTSSLPRVKWTESVLCLLTQLIDSASEFTSTNFLQVIQTQEFLQWATVASWKAGVLEEIFNSVIDSLAADTACQVYQTLLRHKAFHSNFENSDLDIIGLLDSMIKRCERYFKVNIHEAMRSDQWSLLPKSTQSQLLESSAYLYLGDSTQPKGKPPPKGAFSKDRPRPDVPKIASLRKPKIKIREASRVSETKEVKKASSSTGEKEPKDVDSPNIRRSPQLEIQKDKGKSQTMRGQSASSHMQKESLKETAAEGRDRNRLSVEQNASSEEKSTVSSSLGASALSQGIRRSRDKLEDLPKSHLVHKFEDSSIKTAGTENAKIENKTISTLPNSERAISEPLPLYDPSRAKNLSPAQRARHSSESEYFSSAPQKSASRLPVRSKTLASRSRPSSQVFDSEAHGRPIDSTVKQVSLSLPKLTKSAVPLPKRQSEVDRDRVGSKVVSAKDSSPEKACNLSTEFDPAMICKTSDSQGVTATGSAPSGGIDIAGTSETADECQAWSMDKRTQSFASSSFDPRAFKVMESTHINSEEPATARNKDKSDDSNTASASALQICCSTDENSSVCTGSSNQSSTAEPRGITAYVEMHSEVKIVQTNRPVSIGFIVPPE